MEEEMEQNSFFTGKISNYFTASGFGRVLVIRGRRGERVHELIEKTMKEAGILNGVVISGIATFQKINYHHVRDAAADPFDEIRSNDGAFEVTALEGLILNGEARRCAGSLHYDRRASGKRNGDPVCCGDRRRRTSHGPESEESQNRGGQQSV